MYLKIGNVEICNSETDGVTVALKTPIPTLAKSSDTIQPKGSTNPIHFQRPGVSRNIEIGVVRAFKNYREAEVWIVEHMAEMEVLRENGDLEFESMLGVDYMYGTAALEKVEISNFTGVSVETSYLFKAGRAITYLALSVTEEASGEEYIVCMDSPECYPTVRVAR